MRAESRQIAIVAILIVAPCLAQVPDKAPREQLDALVKEYQGLLDAFEKALAAVKEETDRDAYYMKHHPQPEKFYALPRIFVIDAQGVIRFKDVRGKLLDQAVDGLLKELDGASTRPADTRKQ